MKKNINKSFIAFIAISFSLLTSCEDFTEFDRDFIIAEEGAVTNTTQLTRLLLGAYDSNSSYQFIMDQSSYGSDELRIGLGNRGQGLQQHSFSVTTNSDIAEDVYFGAFNQIDNLNRVLALIDNGTVVAVDVADADILNQIEGEARALRAWQYFDLLRAYAPSFESSAPGVPLNTEVLTVSPEDLNLPRNTVGEVLEFIESELSASMQLIPQSLTSPNRFGRNAVRALQARIALYTGTDESLAEARDLATEVLDGKPLSDQATFLSMFRDDDLSITPDSELIFQITRDTEDDNEGFVGEIWTANNGDTFFTASVDFFNSMTNSDVRLTLNIDSETAITANQASNDDLLVGKYLGSAGNNFLNNIKVFRSGEMQLIRAEANARLGNLNDAQTDIEELRTIRGSSQVTPVYSSDAIALDDILLERRIELAFEGHRLFDLKRFGKGINRPADDCSSPDRPGTTCVLEANSFRFTLPIPQAEIFANSGITDADQNPGY